MNLIWGCIFNLQTVRDNFEPIILRSFSKVALIFCIVQDIRRLVLEHKGDCPEAAVTGKYILRWTENDDVDSGIKRIRKFKEGYVTPAGNGDEAGTPPAKGKPGRKPKLLDGNVPVKVPKKPAAGSLFKKPVLRPSTPLTRRK